MFYPYITIQTRRGNREREKKRAELANLVEAMVSFQSPFSFPKDQRNMISIFEGSSSTSTSTNKKRGRENDQDVVIFHHRKNPKSFSDLELHLNTPDTQSRQMHLYNSKTQKRTLKDDQREESYKVVEPEPEQDPKSWSPSDHMSLDLELNLPCGPRSSVVTEKKLKQQKRQNSDIKPQINSEIFLMKKFLGDKGQQSPSLSLSSSSSPSLTSLEGDDELPERVATVCTKCHMLVMLCKSSPACPNCKFMHPLDHCPLYPCMPTLGLLC